MMSTALGSSKPFSNPRLMRRGIFSLTLADTNHSSAAAAAQPSDINSHRCFIPRPSQGEMMVAARAGSLIRIKKNWPLSTSMGLSKPYLIGHSLCWQAARSLRRRAERPSSSFHLPPSYSRQNIAAFRSHQRGRDGSRYSVQNHRVRAERTVHNLAVSGAIRPLSAQPGQAIS